MNREIDVIRLLVEEKRDLNISLISKMLKIDYKNTHNIIKRLEFKKFLSIQTFGKSSKVILNKGFNSLIYEAELKRSDEILKNKNLKLVLDYFERNLKSKFYVLLLFGSHVKKSADKHSDIDLMFIISDDKLEKEVRNTVSLIPLKIHLNIFTEKEFLAMKNSKEQTVGSEAIANNVILHGIEQYYELIK